MFPLLGNTQQNLVPNPSFEVIVSCPTMESQIFLASPWFQPIIGCSTGNVNGCSSSELFNSCSVPNPPYANVGVPTNDFGFQFARTGQGYAGIGVWHDNGARERIEVKLIDSLFKDTIYCVKMFVVNKRLEHISGINLTSTANLQFLFTSDSLLDNSPFGQVYYSPSVINPDNIIISDTSNWTEVSGCYKALGGEHFLTIGNFYNNMNSTVADPSAEAAYYFIDDVSVELSNGQNCVCSINNDSLQNVQPPLFPNVFTPNNDGVNDVWMIPFSDDSEYIYILNRWGEEIERLDSKNPIWTGMTNGVDYSEGIYFYKAFLKDELKTGFIQLIR